MKTSDLLKDTLAYYWRPNLAVALGVLVGTAVLTGALLVGDSVRGSLRDLTLERLGRVDQALVAGHFFRQTLADDLARSGASQGLQATVCPVILIRGSATQPDTGKRAGVSVLGVPAAFWTLGTHGPAHPPGAATVVVNRGLAGEIGAGPGAAVQLQVERPSLVPRETLLGRRSDTIETLDLTVADVLPDRGLGRFSLATSQQEPFNAYVPLETLQESLGQGAQVNAILVAAGPAAGAGASVARRLDELLHDRASLEDLGLRLRTDPRHDYFALESLRLVLSEPIAHAALTTAKTRGIKASPTLTYLANTIADGKRWVPYSMVSAFEPVAGTTMGTLRLDDGAAAPRLGPDDILLNTWTAQALDARVGDAIRLEYYRVGDFGQLRTEQARFTLRGIVPLKGTAADPGWTPRYPGITDVRTMMDWDPPFPIKSQWITRRDERYWDRYRTTPKAFVNLDTAQRLWTSRFGRLTAIRFAAPTGTALAVAAERYGRDLKQALPPAAAGMAFQPVKARGLAASTGGTDFSGLFVGFSFFLIVAAALLIGLLFRLGVERRSAEMGLLLASGFPVGRVRTLLLAEGAILAGLGALAGLIGAIGYAWLMVYGLRTWWRAAVGTPFLSLHLTALSLAIGYAASVVVALLSIAWGARILRRRSPRALLGGHEIDVAPAAGRGPGRLSWMIGVACLVFAVGLGIAYARSTSEAAEAAFFGSGAALLVACLAFFWSGLRRSTRTLVRGHGPAAVARLGVRNGARYPGRSLLTAGLVACASFILVAVGASQQQAGKDLRARDSGAGGFPLIAESDVPVLQDVNDPKVRAAMGFADPAGQVWNGVTVIPLRVRPGEDASCLNLYDVRRPRLVGVPGALIDRGGFAFAETLARTPQARHNSWTLLTTPQPDGAIPAFGDANSVTYILHLKLGSDLVMPDEAGHETRFRIVGLLNQSIFQGGLLVSEANILRAYPDESQYRMFLIDAPAGKLDAVTRALDRGLAAYGFAATSTARRLDAYLAVENTYLSTFQTLGGLGLILGTLGLGVVLFRNVSERRGELALLRAVGFRRGSIRWLVLAENGFLLVFGLVIGAVSALLAVVPHLRTAPADIPWLGLAGILAVVLIVGLIAGLVSVFAALRSPLLPALRAE